ncbi:MAG: 50S ribosomal protein L7/L12 [bacterium]
MTTQEIVSAIENLKVSELVELVNTLKDKFGVTALAVGAPAAGGGAAGAATAVEEEKSTFTVVLGNPGDQKVQVVKAVKTITGLGLKEAKDLVDAAPKPVKDGVSREEAETIKKQLEDLGAKADIK